jgi:hypothetical protein
MAPAEVLSLYGDRWAVECTSYRDLKQLAHGQEPRTWKGKGPERAANLAFWLHGAVWLYYSPAGFARSARKGVVKLKFKPLRGPGHGSAEGDRGAKAPNARG